MNNVTVIGDHKINGLSLGLQFLQIVAEEFNCSNNSLPSTRKDDVRKFFDAEIAGIIEFIKNYLKSVFNQSQNVRKTSFATPQLSPVRDFSLLNSPAITSFTTTAPMPFRLDPGQTPIIGESPGVERTRNLFFDKYIHGTSLDAITEQNCILCLTVLNRLLSWIPLHYMAAQNESILDTIFLYSRNEDNTPQLSRTALSCVNEVLTRNYIPNDQQTQFLSSIFGNAVELLKNPHGLDEE
jgi:hypothetical protein